MQTLRYRHGSCDFLSEDKWKTFEQFNVRVDRRGIVHRRFAKISRIFVVLSTLAAWLSISNHCAVGALVATQETATTVHCHGGQASPEKKNNPREIPCCKLLRATFVAGAKILPHGNKIFLPTPKWILTELIFAKGARFHRLAFELDTGPPAAASFAESVLQRSLLANAPPFVA